MRLHKRGLTGEVEPEEGSDTVGFAAETLALLASNPPEEPYELLMKDADGTASRWEVIGSGERPRTALLVGDGEQVRSPFASRSER